MMAVFALLALLGWGIAAVHALRRRGSHDWSYVWIAPLMAFAYARAHGLWLAVLLQIIGLAGLAVMLIVQSI